MDEKNYFFSSNDLDEPRAYYEVSQKEKTNIIY